MSHLNYPTSLNPCYADTPTFICNEKGNLQVILIDKVDNELPCSLPFTIEESESLEKELLTLDCSSIKDVWHDGMLEDIEWAAWARFKKSFEIETTGL